jgi:hypothetical protein
MVRYSVTILYRVYVLCSTVHDICMASWTFPYRKNLSINGTCGDAEGQLVSIPSADTKNHTRMAEQGRSVCPPKLTAARS